MTRKNIEQIIGIILLVSGAIATVIFLMYPMSIYPKLAGITLLAAGGLILFFSRLKKGVYYPEIDGKQQAEGKPDAPKDKKIFIRASRAEGTKDTADNIIPGFEKFWAEFESTGNDSQGKSEEDQSSH